MSTIQIKSLAQSYLIIDGVVLEPGVTREIDLSSIGVDDLRNLRYMHQLNEIELSKSDRSILNTVFYDVLGLSVAASTAGSSIDSVNGYTSGAVVLDASDVGADLAGAAQAVKTELQGVITPLQTTVSSLSTQQTTTTGNVSTLTGKVTTAEAAITSLQSGATLTPKYTAADKAALTLSNTVLSGLKDGTLAANATVAVTGGQLFTTNGNVSTLTGRVSNVEASVTTLTTSNTTNTTNIGTLTTDLGVAKTNITTLTTDVTGLKSTKADRVDITALQTNKADKTAVASTDVIAEGTTQLYFTTGRVNSAVLTLEAGTNEAVVSGDTLVIAIAKLQAQITDLQAQIVALTPTG